MNVGNQVRFRASEPSLDFETKHDGQTGEVIHVFNSEDADLGIVYTVRFQDGEELGALFDDELEVVA